MDFGWLAVLFAFLAGFALGKKVHGTVGIVVSAALGAAIYLLGLFLIVGSSAILIFDFITQLLMVAFGAILAVFGWFIGENYELPIHRKPKVEG